MVQLQCEKCGKDHDGSYGSGRFCSARCARSRVFSEESRKKTSLTLKKAHADGKITTDLTKWKAAGARQSKLRQLYAPQRRLEKAFEELGWDSKRLRIIQEQNGACQQCGLIEWRGQVLSLEIDHLDGNHSNNSRENLRALCPNCHSLTPTWRGRNNKLQVK